MNAFFGGSGDFAEMIDFNTVEKVILAKRIGRKLSGGCEGHDRATLESVARRLVGDASEAVREALSFETRRDEALAGDIVGKIASDSADVAVPFLEESQAVDEELLIALVRAGKGYAQTAIARREVVSERLSLAIAEHGSARAATALSRNEHAAISEAVCETLFTRFQESPAVMGELASRQDLPPKAGARLRRHFNVDDLRHVETQLGKTSFGNILVELRTMQRRGELSLQAWRELIKQHGHRYLEAGLVVFTKLPLRNISLLLGDTGGRGQRELCKRAGIGWEEMQELISLAQQQD
ncbi:MAG: hypothetical protein Tsb0016_18270 [Sphingomonadales bacterium]